MRIKNFAKNSRNSEKEINYFWPVLTPKIFAKNFGKYEKMLICQSTD